MSERLKNIYNAISNDMIIKQRYKQVEECNNNMWAFHGMQHIKNVENRVESILKKLNCSQDQIYLAKICAYLHDIGATNGKDGHAQKSADFCKEYFKKFDLTKSEKEQMIFTIQNHGNFVKEGGLILAVLVFCDKLDIDKTRISPSGYAIEGMNQMQWIENITVDIKDKLIVNLTCHKNFNKKAFEDYYFCKKVFDSIKSFANIIGKNYQVLLNSKIWDYK